MKATFAGASHAEFRRFHFPVCGFNEEVEVVGLGEGAQSFLNARGTAAKRAKVDAIRDVRRTLSIATCPECGHRDAKAVRRKWAFALLPHAIGFSVVALSGWIPLLFDLNMKEDDKWIVGWVTLGIAAFIALFMVPMVFVKWSSAKQGVRFRQEGES